MERISWTDDCSVGVRQLDEHHKHLFELLHSIGLACDRKGQPGNVEAIIHELADYATYHFAAEERLMDATGYYDSAAHKMEHQRFVRKVADFQRDLSEGRNMRTIELISFLGNWLIHHIMEVDKKLGLYLNIVNIR
ncbi:MAG TPA: bacteriohemerythrin [Geobacteraceae bacterium]